MSALRGAGAWCGFFLAAAGRTLLEIKIMTSPKRRTTFTQMLRSTLRLRLPCRDYALGNLYAAMLRYARGGSICAYEENAPSVRSRAEQKGALETNETKD